MTRLFTIYNVVTIHGTQNVPLESFGSGIKFLIAFESLNLYLHQISLTKVFHISKVGGIHGVY